MTLTSKVGKLRGLHAIRFRAVINPSKKLGIPRRYQKTWSVKSARPDLEEWALMISASREASRWEKKVMENLKVQNKKNAEFLDSVFL
jgi:hypothetical protein